MVEWTLSWVDDCCVQFVVPGDTGTGALQRELEAELAQLDHLNGLQVRLEWLASHRGLRLHRLADWSTGPYGEAVVLFGLGPQTRRGHRVTAETLRRIPTQPHRA